MAAVAASRSDARAGRRVEAAEIDGEVAVDEGPHVVVAGEAERRRGAGRVRERVVQLAGEREVVPGAAACSPRPSAGAHDRRRVPRRACRSGRTRWRPNAGRRWPRSAGGQRRGRAREGEEDELVVGVGAARAGATGLVVPPAEVDGVGELGVAGCCWRRRRATPARYRRRAWPGRAPGLRPVPAEELEVGVTRAGHRGAVVEHVPVEDGNHQLRRRGLVHGGAGPAGLDGAGGGAAVTGDVVAVVRTAPGGT